MGRAEVQQKPTSLWAFGRAVFSEVWIYVAYGTGAAILSFWGYATRAAPPAWVFLAVIAFGFLVGGFRTWQKERIDRNAIASEISRLQAKIDELGRPRFVPEITDVFIGNSNQPAGWISIYVYLVIRNQGADSAIDRWKIIVVPPQPAGPFILTERGLSEWWLGHDGEKGNLLHDREIIKRGGEKKGWLLCEGSEARFGLSSKQRAAVKVFFKDVHDNEYSVVDPPGFHMGTVG